MFRGGDCWTEATAPQSELYGIRDDLLRTTKSFAIAGLSVQSTKTSEKKGNSFQHQQQQQKQLLPLIPIFEVFSVVPEDQCREDGKMSCCHLYSISDMRQ